MTKKERNYKNKIYEEILKEKLNKNFIKQEYEIRETQCIKRLKRGTMRCRLNIQDKKCINFQRRK